MAKKNQPLWFRCLAESDNGDVTLLHSYDPETGETYHNDEACATQAQKNSERLSCKASEIVSNEWNSPLLYL